MDTRSKAAGYGAISGRARGVRHRAWSLREGAVRAHGRRGGGDDGRGFFEHYKASFGNKWMWSPVLVTPPVVLAGVMGVFSERWAKTVLPATAAVYTANGLAGEYFHARGVARKPGGWALASYNVPMGPPIAAPGLMCVVGGMGLLAALLRREGGRAT